MTSLSSCPWVSVGYKEGARGHTRLLGTQLHLVNRVQKPSSPAAVSVSRQRDHVYPEHARVHSRARRPSDFACLGILRGSLHDNASLISPRQSLHGPNTDTLWCGPAASRTETWIAHPSKVNLQCYMYNVQPRLAPHWTKSKDNFSSNQRVRLLHALIVHRRLSAPCGVCRQLLMSRLHAQSSCISSSHSASSSDMRSMRVVNLFSP